MSFLPTFLPPVVLRILLALGSGFLIAALL
jgi:hypothetical protein